MKFAIISDIHGNDTAFKAVMKDAEINGVDEFIFVGDYYCDLPYPNEVINRIKGIKNKHVISGNKEDYLRQLHMTDKSQWTHNQFNALYWNYRELTTENLEYLMELPKRKRIHSGGKQILILHSISDLFKGTDLKLFSSSKYAERMDERVYSHEEFLEYVKRTLLVDDDLKRQLMISDEQIYIFGHTHIQWHAELHEKILINGGSCGVPLDFCSKAPYTIMEIKDDDVVITERRVRYDVSSLINDVRESELYHSAEGWMELIIKHLNFARDEIAFFFRHINMIVKESDNKNWPIDNELWDNGIENWLKEDKTIVVDSSII